MLKQLARAEGAVHKGIPHSSITSHTITGMRVAQGEISQLHIEATADDTSKSTAQLRVARAEDILGSESATQCRTMGVYQQVGDQILLLDSDDAEQVLQVNGWIDINLEVVLDSSACEHVMDSEDSPGCIVLESPGSTRGQGFVVGNGARVPNEG